MAALTLTYARLYNLGNYENEKIEITVSVDNDDVSAARIVAVAAVEAEHVQMLAERRGDVNTPRTAPVPASDKQRQYIARLQDDMCWSSEQMAAYAREQSVDLVSMTVAQASTFIDGLKHLGQVQSGELPF
jgi:hypothetical protein